MLFRFTAFAFLLLSGFGAAAQQSMTPLRTGAAVPGALPPPVDPKFLITPPAPSPVVPRGAGPWKGAQAEARTEYDRWLGRSLRYPAKALRAGTQGRVLLRAEVSPEGAAEKLTFVRMTPIGPDSAHVVTDANHPVVRELVGESKRLLKATRFAPAPAKTTEEVEVVFRIKGN